MVKRLEQEGKSSAAKIKDAFTALEAELSGSVKKPEAAKTIAKRYVYKKLWLCGGLAGANSNYFATISPTRFESLSELDKAALKVESLTAKTQ